MKVSPIRGFIVRARVKRVQGVNGLNKRADLGDVYNLYLLLLGRSPESRPVVREMAGFPIAELFESMLDSSEFQENVLQATIAGGALPQQLFPTCPSTTLRRWAASRFSDSSRSDAELQGASSWSALLGAVLSQSTPRDFLQKIAGTRTEAFKRALGKTAGSHAPNTWRERVPGALELALFRLGVTRSKLLKQRAQVAQSGLFDSQFYRTEYPDVAEQREDPLTHFMVWGSFEGRRPNVLFDTHWYLGCYAHLRTSLTNPLLHYLDSADDVSPKPNPLFDRDWYLHRYPDVRDSKMDSLAHFLRHGAAEGRSPHPAFDLPFYVSTFEQGVPKNANPLEYYLEHGRELGHEPNLIFDTDWYIRHFAAGSLGGGNPLIHYLAQDPVAMIDPSAQFSTMGYLHTYPAVRASGANALEHYLQTGRKEGREPLLTAPSDLPLRVAIIAEVSLPQCLKYRVLQRQKMIQSLGHYCSVISWRNLSLCVDALRTHGLFIFYRVPAYAEMLEIMDLARRAGLPILWEVDDLIFSGKDYLTNQNLNDLDPELQRSVLAGVQLYQKALITCGAGVASTPGVAEAMRRVGVDAVFVIENALDDETLSLAAEIGPRVRLATSAQVVITYGSGGKTHDTDFRLAAPSLLAVLKARPLAKLRIIGELNLPEAFATLGDQVERFPLLPFPDYIQLLSQSDIAICPVEDTVFCDAKSNIKFLEAAVLGLPSICSPRSAFKLALRHGENGFFAEGDQQWAQALTSLMDDAELRRRLGETARRDVLRDYDPMAVAQRQVAPLLEAYAKPKPPLRVLSVNTYYSPHSYGGATIVAEQLNKRLNARADTQVTVFTGNRAFTERPYRLTRDLVEGCVTFRMEMANEADPATDFDNALVKAPFRDALRASGANVVHLHAIQGLSAALLEVCVEEGVPVVVTLHDAWWICGRMFMVTGENRYCGQWTIDVDVCAACVTDAGLNYFRQLRLANLLNLADLALTPSAFFRDLYIANGWSPERVQVNRNGVQAPATAFKRSQSEKLRLGFVGGMGPIKGIEVIRAALEGLARGDYTLVLVDNTLNLGFSSLDVSGWAIAGEIQIVPAYTQATLDDFFSGIDVLLFPTQWKESFGLTVREALLRDVWVIASDAGGVTEDILDGINGDVIPFGDDGTVLRLMVERRLALGSKVRDYVNPAKARIATFETQAEELHDLLAALVADPARQQLQTKLGGLGVTLQPESALVSHRPDIKEDAMAEKIGLVKSASCPP